MTFQIPGPAAPNGVPPGNTETSGSRQVTGYSVVLPPGWRRIPIRHGTTSAIREIADEVLAGIPADGARDHAALLLDQIEHRLSELAKQACPLGGVDLYLPISHVHGTAIPASFIVSEGTPSAAGIVDSGQVAGYLAAALPGASPVMVDGCAGARLQFTAPAEKILGIEAVSHRVDYTLPVPGRPGQWLIVTFAISGDGDPEGEFANLLVELFDSIMLTFRWVTAHATADGA
jgi:hypothetical protein